MAKRCSTVQMVPKGGKKDDAIVVNAIQRKNYEAKGYTYIESSFKPGDPGGDEEAARLAIITANPEEKKRLEQALYDARELESKTEATLAGADETDGDEAKEYPYLEHTHAELLAFAKEAGLAHDPNASPEDLAKALSDKGYRPKPDGTGSKGS